MSKDLSRDGPRAGEEICKYKVHGEGQEDQSCADFETVEVAIHKGQDRLVDERSGKAEEYIDLNAQCHRLG